MKNNYVYILTNYKRTVLYIGVTSDLKYRIEQHRQGSFSSFTKKYKAIYLVYFEGFDSILDAIKREKYLKGKARKKKNELINNFNPEWKDLSLDLI